MAQKKAGIGLLFSFEPFRFAFPLSPSPFAKQPHIDLNFTRPEGHLLCGSLAGEGYTPSGETALTLPCSQGRDSIEMPARRVSVSMKTMSKQRQTVRWP